MTYAEAVALFERLGQPVGNARVVSRSYWRLALRFHPDRGGTEADMMRINAAYAALKAGPITAAPQAGPGPSRPPKVYRNPVWRWYQRFDALQDTNPDRRFLIFMGLMLTVFATPLIALAGQALFGIPEIWGTFVELTLMMALAFSRMYWIEVVSRR